MEDKPTIGDRWRFDGLPDVYEVLYIEQDTLLLGNTRTGALALTRVDLQKYHGRRT